MVTGRRAHHRASRGRWHKWLEELDPASPRAVDYVVGAVLFLLLALLHVGERNYAFDLNREVFTLEERLATLRGETDLLVAEATRLADRERITRIAVEQLGMLAPEPADIAYIYYVPSEAQRPAAPPPRPPLQ